MKFIKPLMFLIIPFCAFSHEDQPPLPSKDATLSAQTCPGRDGAYIAGEFIWWRARGEELFFAQNITSFSIDPAGNIRVAVKDEEVDYEYAPGWKLGIGGNLPFDGWDIYAKWTHFHNHPVTTAHTSPARLSPLFGQGTPGQELLVGEKATGSWNVMFNAIDIDWGRMLYLSHSLYIRPSFGVKTAWIHQRLGFKIEDNSGIVSQNPFPNVFLQATNKYWGIGPYFAMSGVWNWAWGFGLYGELSGALFWGQFRQDLEVENVNTLNGTTVNAQSNTKTHRVRPTLQMFIGLDWRSCVYKDWIALNFRAGWEVQYFWSQFVNPFGGIEESDFSLEGITASARIDF